MRYIGHNDPEEYMRIVEFSERELRLFDKHNPTLFSICMYISRRGILPGKFKTLDKNELITKPADLIGGCTYRTDAQTSCPVTMFFGQKVQNLICKNCSCRIFEEFPNSCCLEMTWKEAIKQQRMEDYSKLPLNKRLKRLDDLSKLHIGVKVV